jgi:hypothetical protein
VRASLPDSLRVTRESRDDLVYPLKERANGLPRVRRDGLASEDARAGGGGLRNVVLGGDLFSERDPWGSPPRARE